MVRLTDREMEAIDIALERAGRPIGAADILRVLKGMPRHMRMDLGSYMFFPNHEGGESPPQG